MAGKREKKDRQGRVMLRRGEHPHLSGSLGWRLLLILHTLGWPWGQPHSWSRACQNEVEVSGSAHRPHRWSPSPSTPGRGISTHLYANHRLPAPGEALCSEHPRHSCSASRGWTDGQQPLRPTALWGLGHGNAK